MSDEGRDRSCWREQESLQELAGSQELLEGAGVTAALGAETLFYLGHQTRHLAPEHHRDQSAGLIDRLILIYYTIIILYY